MTAEEIRALRQEMGFSVAKFARLLRVAKRTVLRWEAGVTRVPGPVQVLAPYLLRDAVAERAARHVEEMEGEISL